VRWQRNEAGFAACAIDVLQKDYVMRDQVCDSFPDRACLSGNISEVFSDFADLGGYAGAAESANCTQHGKFDEKQVPGKYTLNTFHCEVSSEE